jgi:GNAT superfamily N-acetyltransferase
VIAVRAAKLDDAPGMARVIVQTWRSTYRGIVPDEVLDGMDETAMAPWWAESIGRSDAGTPIFVAESEHGEVVGVTLVDAPDERAPEREPGYARELRILYVLDAFQGQGIGRRLVGAVVEQLAGQGIGALTIPVFAVNVRARGFYEALGARLLRMTPLVMRRFGFTIETAIYGWPDTTALRRTLSAECVDVTGDPGSGEPDTSQPRTRRTTP